MLAIGDHVMYQTFSNHGPSFTVNSGSARQRAFVFCAATLTLLCAASAHAHPRLGRTDERRTECSFSKTNGNCTLVIDRLNPLAAPTIQMYPGAGLTVIVMNPHPFERYFL